ncbi:MAG: hypothetical protein M1837_000002 [Sclerophora amabilis]|nr:MAG: hypothetical protein M1837_000002 [Sclerophora amabilis]
MRSVEQLSDKAKEEVAQFGSRIDAITAYDNFEQVEGVKEQRLDDNSKFHSVTTGEVFGGREIPATGLLQSMLNCSVRLDYFNDILKAPGNQLDAVQTKMTSYIDGVPERRSTALQFRIKPFALNAETQGTIGGTDYETSLSWTNAIQREYKQGEPDDTERRVPTPIGIGRGVVRTDSKTGSNTWYEIDRAIKLHNGRMKDILRTRHTSSIDLDYLFEYCALNAAQFKELERKMESFFEVRLKSRHAAKSAKQDIIRLASELKRWSMKFECDREVKFKVADLLGEGLSRIESATDQFNKHECGSGNETVAEEEDEENQTAADPAVEYFHFHAEASDEFP